MKPVQEHWRLALGSVLWTYLLISFLIDLSSAAPSSDLSHSNATSDSLNVSLREMRAIRRSKFPLKSDDPKRNTKRTTECRLGKTVHEIGDTWNPSLGEPFGTMYCIECACEPVQKKRKIVARIRCRNVKSLCPKLECNDAISLPTQCCKVCPVIEEVYKNGTVSDSDSSYNSEDDIKSSGDNNREYAALLTPQSSSTIKSSTGLGEAMDTGLAAGRFIFLKKSLYYSFVYNDDMPRAKYVQFVDSQGNVVEEQEVTINQYQKETRKICGVWRKIPRVYRKLLKEEKLHAALVTEKVGSQDNDVFLGGRIAKQKYVSTEMYSSLLESRDESGGGMAVITVSPSTGSIYTNILFNSDSFEENRDIGITVRISDASANQGVEETVTISKINYDTNSIEIRSILEAEQLEALSRGRLFFVVYSPNNPEFRLTGLIQARATCDIFDTMLEIDTGNSQGSKSEGLAWVYPLPDGSWSFNVQLNPEFEEEDDHPQAVKLEVGGKILEDNLPFQTIGGNMTHQIVGGMGPRHYQLLYEENLYLLIVTDQGNILRGRLVYRIFGDAQLSDMPLMISSNTQVAPKAVPLKTLTQGLLWIAVDNDCGLNYQLSLSQSQSRQEKRDLMRLEIMETLELSLKGFPVRSYVLDNFESSEYEGIYKDFPKITYAHLKAGDALFKIVRVSDSALLASTILKNIYIPTSCLPNINTELIDNLASPDYFLDGTAEDTPSGTMLSGKCFYDGKFRDEYSQWTPFNDTCSICNCYKGQVKCEAVVCPALKCANPVLVTGECCRSCLSTGPFITANKNDGQGCNVEGDRWHPAGSSWHPYMPPNGFMICTTCSCREDTLKVECMKEECPALECAPEVAVFPKALSCCRVCPPKKEIDQDTINDAVAEYQGKKGGPSEREVLEQGGCRFRDELHENGEEWSHRVEPFGYIPCMSCTCLNGNTKCGRRKCPSLSCEVKVQVPGECCQSCGSNTEYSSSGALPKRPFGSIKTSSSKSNGRYNRKQHSNNRGKGL